MSLFQMKTINTEKRNNKTERTQKRAEEVMEKMKNEMKVERTNTSSAMRRKQSATDGNQNVIILSKM